MKSVSLIPFLIVVVLALAIGVLPGCAAITGAGPVPDASAPSVEIVIPGEECLLGGLHGEGQVLVAVDVENFVLTGDIGLTNIPGEGHIHYYLDASPPLEPGRAAVTGPGTYAESDETAYYWPKPENGVHTFSVELVNNDHTSLDPPAFDTVTVNVDDFDLG